MTGLEREIQDVAWRIQAEATRQEAKGTRKDVIECARLLRTYGTRLHRLNEHACNRELTSQEERIERDTEARVLAICHQLGVTVRFNGDPRGAPIQIPCARENANGFSGDCIVTPFGPARDYR